MCAIGQPPLTTAYHFAFLKIMCTHIVDGEVWAAKDPTNNSEKVAIKKIHNCFVQATEAKRILRELRILRHVSHPNIIRIRDVLHPQVRTRPPVARPPVHATTLAGYA